MSNAIAFLNDIAHNLRNQDNLYTSFPIYEVQEQQLITGIDTDYTDNIGWFDTDSGSLADDDEAKELEAKFDETSEVPEGWIRGGYDHRWEQVASFFTQKAAEQYMATNSHRHEGELRMYVNSAYRNPEWKELRRLLSGPLLYCIDSLSQMVEMMDRCDEHGAGSEWHTQAKTAIASLDTYKDPLA